jgi:hypothetical protein
VAPVTAEQADLLGGAAAECQAIVDTTEPGTLPTIDTTAPPATMATQARQHAGTVRTIGAQVADSTWTWVLGAIATGASLLLGGGVGGIIAKRGASGLLQTAVEFGTAMADALKKANPPVAEDVIKEQVKRQESLGHRDDIRAAVARAEVAGAVAKISKAQTLDEAQDKAEQSLAEAQDRAARAERAGHQATAELRRVWAENAALRDAHQPSALTRKRAPRKGRRA